MDDSTIEEMKAQIVALQKQLETVYPESTTFPSELKTKYKKLLEEKPEDASE